VEAYFLQTINILGYTYPDRGFRFPTLRLFRNRPEYRYVGRIHESIIPSILQRVGRESIRVAAGVRVRHYGYLKQEVQQKEKARRNLSLLEKELSFRQPDSFLYYNLGVEYLRVGENSRALEYFDLAEKDIRWKAAFAPSLVRKKADCLALLGRKEEAIQYLEKMASTYPDYTDLHYQQGLLYMEELDFSRAVAAFEKCLAMGDSPSHYPTEEGAGGHLACQALGNVYELMLEKDKAVEVFRRALTYDPKNLQPLVPIIRLLLSSKGLEGTVAYLDAYFNLATPAANLGVGDIFLANYLPQTALCFLDEAARLGASGDPYHALMGEALLLCGDVEKAAVELIKVPPGSPHYPRTRRNLCLLYWLIEDYGQAGALLENWAQEPVQELYWTVHRCLSGSQEGLPGEQAMVVGAAYLDLLQKCLCVNESRLTEKILPLAKGVPELAVAVGKVFHRQGLEDEAQEWLERGLTMGLKDGEAALVLARILCSKQEWEGAEANYQRAVQWDPDDLEAYVEMAGLYREQALAVIRDLPGAGLVTSALTGSDHPRLSLCMIVKDEAENLPRCLNSVKGAVDEIIVVDTGSSDDTPQIALKYGARVFRFPWNGDFSAARNFSLEQATGDWILVLDADEELREGDGAKVKALLNAEGVEGYCFQLVNFYGHQSGCDYMTDLGCRLFRNRPAYRYRRALHEQVIDQIIASKGDAAVKVANVQVLHYGYLTPIVTRKNKSERNLSIIQRAVQEKPENKFLRYSLGVERLNRGEYEEALTLLKQAYQPGLSYTSDVVLKMVVCLKELHRYQDALELIQKSISEYPGFTDLIFLRGEIYLQQGNHQEAVQSFQKCLEMGDAPINYCGTNGMGGFRAFYYLGKAYESMGRDQEALEAYRQSVAANSQFHFPLYAMARVLRRHHDAREVIDLIKPYFDLSDPGTLFLLADICMGTKDYEVALGFIQDAAETVGQNKRLTGRWAYMSSLCLAHLGNYDEAITTWDKVPPTSSYYVPALTWQYLMAWVRQDRDQASRILADLQKADPVMGQNYAFIHNIIFEEDIAGAYHDAKAGVALTEMADRLNSIGETEPANCLLKHQEALVQTPAGEVSS